MKSEGRDLFELPLSRRALLSRIGLGFGSIALADMLRAESERSAAGLGGILEKPHFPPRARRVIYLFQSGGPSQMDLFDYKPLLDKMHGKDLPASVRMGQRLTTMSANQARLPIARSIFRFERHGKCGAWVSELLPHTAKVVDEICFLKSVYTEAINHDPAITLLQTGTQRAGLPSIGAWVSYGLGTDNKNLPTFCVLISQNRSGQPLYSRLWGSGFLPSRHQGVKFLPGANPVHDLKSPPGISPAKRRVLLERLQELHEIQRDTFLDREIETRIAQYELAFRMQASVPEALDISKEPDKVLDMYGPEARKPGTFAYNCVLARRLAERGVKFVQLYHQGWDHHGGLPGGIRRQSKDTDQPAAALILDLKQRGLLEDTLVIWGGEFGRTTYCQGKLTPNDYGRDHHPRCFTMWMAGGGVRGGVTFGETDDFSYNIVKDPVHVHDFHATLLYLLGIDHERLTFKYQGRRFRLTDVAGRVVKEILA